MKIVHVSNFSFRKAKHAFYGLPFKLTNGLTRLGHCVLNFCDRDVADSYAAGIRILGHSYANRRLLALCEEVRPDLLLLGHCAIIRPETLEAIRRMVPDIHIAHWNCDALFIPANVARLQALLPLMDATFVTTAGTRLHALTAGGGRVTFMPNPIDSSIETLRVFEKERVENDLVFLSGKRRYAADKTELCHAVKNNAPHIKFDVRGLSGGPSVYGAKFFDVLGNSKMALSISAKNDVFLYSSDRMAQVLGCGLLTFVDRRTGFDSIFRDDEIVFYQGIDDLIAKLTYFNRHDIERRQIAGRGWQRAHRMFNETLVAQWIIDATFRVAPSQQYSWPTMIYGDDMCSHRWSAKPGVTPHSARHRSRSLGSAVSSQYG
jgi:hypothetical protein